MSDEASDDAFERGMRTRRAVLGDDHVERAMAATTPLTETFQAFITRCAWGEVWSRDGLDRRTRSAITIAMLVTLGRSEELAMHLRGGIRNGLTRDEIGEILLQTAVYAGVPAANQAFRIATDVLDRSP